MFKKTTNGLYDLGELGRVSCYVLLKDRNAEDEAVAKKLKSLGQIIIDLREVGAVKELDETLTPVSVKEYGEVLSVPLIKAQFDIKRALDNALTSEDLTTNDNRVKSLTDIDRIKRKYFVMGVIEALKWVLCDIPDEDFDYAPWKKG